MSIVIAGFVSSDKDPGFVGETKYGQGKQSIGAIPLKCLVTGNKTSAGSATANADVIPIFSEDDADTYLGEGSEIAMQAYAALQVPGVTLYAAPVAEATGGSEAAGTLTLTFGGTWTTGGTVIVYLAGKAIQVGIGSSDTTSNAATSTSTAINATRRLPMTSSPSSAVVTVTTRNKGARANDYFCRVDLSAAPAGLTCTLAGGTAVTGGVTPFHNGAGADDVTAVLALLATDVYDYQAWAQNDATNLAKIKTQATSEAGPLIGHMEHYQIGANGTSAAAVSLAQTTLNDQRGTVIWYKYGETHPCQLAAVVAALRSVNDGDNPNGFWAKNVLPGVAPQSQKSDIAGRSTRTSLLNSGVTPLFTNVDGTVTIVRGIVTHSLNGSAPDYRTLDWADAVVPDRVRKELGALYDADQQVNPFAGPDPSGDEKAAAAGTLTPSLWNAIVYDALKDWETQGWLDAVDDNLPQSEWNTAAKRIMSAVPVVVKAKNYQLGASVRQTAA